MWVANSPFLMVLKQKQVTPASLLTLLEHTDDGKGGGCSRGPPGTLPILTFRSKEESS